MKTLILTTRATKARAVLAVKFPLNKNTCDFAYKFLIRLETKSTFFL